MRIEDIALLSWYILIASVVLTAMSACVELDISGNASGNGSHMLEIGNDSILSIYENVTGWQIATCPNMQMNEVRR
jgi:hypothetical protein